MRQRRSLLIVLFFSFLVHVFIFSFFRFEIDAKRTPAIYVWPDILNKRDLLSKEKVKTLPKEAFFSSDKLRYKYFSKAITGKVNSFFNQEVALHKKTNNLRKNDNLREFKPQFYYLWEDRMPFLPLEEEKVSYKAFVSKRGKVLFTYPQKLTANSSGNLHFQEHIHSAGFFLNDKFFWTKVDGVVK